MVTLTTPSDDAACHVNTVLDKVVRGLPTNTQRLAVLRRVQSELVDWFGIVKEDTSKGTVTYFSPETGARVMPEPEEETVVTVQGSEGPVEVKLRLGSAVRDMRAGAAAWREFTEDLLGTWDVQKPTIGFAIQDSAHLMRRINAAISAFANQK